MAPRLTSDAAKSLPRHTPFVALHSNNPLPDVLNIETNEERGAYDVVEYLIRQGHRRIMHVSGERELTGAKRRIAGYQRALTVARIPADENLCIAATFAGKDARRTMRQWLEKNARERLPEAVFCANDAIAAGCMEAFAEAGLRVPEDISVVGFDDTLGARTTIPQLTTVRQPLEEMGARAVEVLLALIQRHDDGAAPAEFPNPIVFPVELIPRASVARPGVL